MYVDQYAKEKLRVESEIGREKELSVVQAIFHVLILSYVLIIIFFKIDIPGI
jgi:ABC-type transporter Mla maintaining outer membrane lipid asymmetry permease subunit MlaE